MELLTIIVCVLAGALISNLPSLRRVSENAISSVRKASMEAKLPEIHTCHGQAEHPPSK